MGAPHGGRGRILADLRRHCDRRRPRTQARSLPRSARSHHEAHPRAVSGGAEGGVASGNICRAARAKSRNLLTLPRQDRAIVIPSRSEEPMRFGLLAGAFAALACNVSAAQPPARETGFYTSVELRRMCAAPAGTTRKNDCRAYIAGVVDTLFGGEPVYGRRACIPHTTHI